jgi:hypothetical protein
MSEAGLSASAISAFKHNYEQLVAGVTGLVGPRSWAEVASACLEITTCSASPAGPDLHAAGHAARHQGAAQPTRSE